jgi:hypothetical protein
MGLGEGLVEGFDPLMALETAQRDTPHGRLAPGAGSQHPGVHPGDSEPSDSAVQLLKMAFAMSLKVL